MPTLSPNEPRPRVEPRLTKNTLSLDTVLTSMAAENGTLMRGCRLKPSSVLMTSKSSQVTAAPGDAAQSGLGRFTRRKVFWVKSKTVKRLLGKRVLAGSSASKSTFVLLGGVAAAVADIR